MAASNPIFSVKLTEDDVPGAKLRSPELSEHSVLELKRWLACRALPLHGNKQQLLERCRNCIDAGQDGDILIAVDGGKWYAQKVQSILQQSDSTVTPNTDIPVLPVSGWGKFPSGNIPKAFCYGVIYNHIISTANLVNPETGDADTEMSTDFNTTKPMKKGRQYFVSGHVTNMFDQRKGNFQFYKANVLASYTLSERYNVSITLRTDDAMVVDASCDCKASAMGRCSHVAALLFAIEDYTIQFGYDIPSCTRKLCTWNVGRKKRKNPQSAHSQQYSKKAAPDRILNHDPRCPESKTAEADDEFINLFITTLPNCGNDSMFGHLLEVIYEDYYVDRENLQRKVDWAQALEQSDSTEVKEPSEVPGTLDQTNSETWHQARRCKVTASVAKDVAVTKSSRGLFSLLNRNLWGLDKIETPAMTYGKNHEDDAYNCYKSRDSEALSKTGFWTNPEYPGLGCSPDGLIRDKDGAKIGVLEIKCPYVLQKTSPLDIQKLKPTQVKNLCFSVENGASRLKRTHKYFYQVQMQMAVCDVDFCDFVIWSPNGMTVERIMRDKEFWSNLHPKLRAYYTNILLPEYFEMRVPRRLLPIVLQ